MSKAIVLYLHVHQPYRIRQYSIFDAGDKHDYFNGSLETNQSNEGVLRKVAEKSYLPMNAVLMELLRNYPEFRLSLSITGTVIEQFEQWAPDVLESFKELVRSGRVEIVGETYYHSLAFFYSRKEFEKQVEMHRKKVLEVFGVVPEVFRNTEFAYNNDLAYWADKAGYKALLAEGWDNILQWRSPNFVYRPSYTENIKLLMKNYKLSDDIAFRFSNKGWSEWPLSADRYVNWLNDSGEATNFNLFMDYETFGEHQWADTGIFDFVKQLPEEWLKTPGHTFLTVSEAADAHESKDYIDSPQTVTWADTERDLSAWLGNPMQQQACKALYSLEEAIFLTDDNTLINDWRLLTTSDHFYYMCTKWFSDGDIHAYFSPYETPYEANMNFMNAWHDLQYRLSELGERT